MKQVLVAEEIVQAQATAQLQVARVQPVLEGRRILLVEDDIRDVLSISSALEKYSAQVEVARSIDALKKLDNYPQLDLVLLDVMMLGIDTILHEIRMRPRFETIPILAILQSMNDDEMGRFPQKFDGYLTKPIDVERLASFIRDGHIDNR
jgi:CheY-like chemotaxis protein